MDEPNPSKHSPESKQEALMRLLCHYLIYIGKSTSLLEASSDEKTLISRWRSQWNKPAAFTWNSSKGLEMHYRIQPPADWIVSSSEDESMSSIDLDLSEFGDVDEFTVNTDLLKCTACDTFWAMLDTNGYCHNCQPSFDPNWLFQDADIISDLCVSFENTDDLVPDASCELQIPATWDGDSAWSSLLEPSLGFLAGLEVSDSENITHQLSLDIDMRDFELDYPPQAVTSNNNRAFNNPNKRPVMMDCKCNHRSATTGCKECTGSRSRGKEIGPPSNRSPKRLLNR